MLYARPTQAESCHDESPRFPIDEFVATSANLTRVARLWYGMSFFLLKIPSLVANLFIGAPLQDSPNVVMMKQ